MRLLQDLGNLKPLQGCFLSIGNFDGVHRGHRVILSELVSRAKMRARPAVVLTFDPHPLKLLRPEFTPPLLTTLQHKAELIGESGVDYVVAYPTDDALLSLSADEFFQNIVLDQFHATGVVEGPNFFFGKDRAGNTRVLKQLCEAHSLELNIVEPQVSGEQMVSSSTVREFLKTGRLREAAEMLGRWYSLTGTVAIGAQRGRLIGFPTANLSNVRTMIPADGVYAALCTLEGTTYDVALNIGPNPTFQDGERKIEAHLLDFTGDLYGRELTLCLIERVRKISTFDSADALQKQVTVDVEKIRQILQEMSHASS